MNMISAVINMGFKFTAFFFFFSTFLFSSHGHGFNHSTPPVSSNLKHYIVYMGSHSYPNSETVMDHNHQLLSSVVGSVAEAQKAVVHHYTKSFRGFSALLTAEQVENLKKNNSIISVFESKIHTLHTTRSWYFLESTGKVDNSKGDFDRHRKDKIHDVIVGHIDSGLWPESKSFSDDQLGPLPNHWRGECVCGQGFTKANCNKKIIGARYYYQGYENDVGPLRSSISSPRDDFGHGTQTASVAAGSEVRVANVPGLGSHVARGGASQSRIAVYKACWHNICSCADIMKAFDDAIYDGVDVITMSAGPDKPASYFEDCFAVGSLHAFQRGVFVAASAGNYEERGSVVNVAPWVLTVAASTIDREVYSFVRLGNQKQIMGYGLNMDSLEGYHGIVIASNVANPGVNYVAASFCQRNSLNLDLIKGKIVVCAMDQATEDVVEKSNVVKEGGGVGMILIDQYINFNELAYFAVPTSVLSHRDAQKLFAYVSSTRNPTASILHNRGDLGTKPAPMMQMTSSKGPNVVTPDIIKPDITAPGVNILAAWPPSANQSADALSFRMGSGTSMACPHAAGVAAVVKAHNKEWGPAEIKSALMTTARTKDNTGNKIRFGESEATPLELGSGHLYPDHALSPGLVYDFDMNDITDFLCYHGATEAQLELLIGKPHLCKIPLVAPYDLNYPSIGVGLMTGPMSIYRTVTFKGGKNDPKIFHVHYDSPPPGVEMKVVPEVLDFSNGATKANYRVDFYPRKALGYVYGSITWSDGHKHVRTPILLNLVF